LTRSPAVAEKADSYDQKSKVECH